MRIRLLMVALICAVSMPVLTWAFFPPPEDLVPLHRFYEKRRGQHVYTHDPNEIKQWHESPLFEDQGIIGLVSPKQLPDTFRLWRAIGSGRYFHYKKAPARAVVGLQVEDKVFAPYVWKAAGNGRVAIYSSVALNGSDAFFDTDQEKVKQLGRDLRQSKGITRNEDGLVFWVYPYIPEKAEEKTEEPTDEKPAVTPPKKAGK